MRFHSFFIFLLLASPLIVGDEAEADRLISAGEKHFILNDCVSAGDSFRLARIKYEELYSSAIRREVNKPLDARVDTEKYYLKLQDIDEAIERSYGGCRPDIGGQYLDVAEKYFLKGDLDTARNYTLKAYDIHSRVNNFVGISRSVTMYRAIEDARLKQAENLTDQMVESLDGGDCTISIYRYNGVVALIEQLKKDVPKNTTKLYNKESETKIDTALNGLKDFRVRQNKICDNQKQEVEVKALVRKQEFTEKQGATELWIYVVYGGITLTAGIVVALWLRSKVGG